MYVEIPASIMIFLDILLKVAIIITTSFALSGYATTDIIRLTKGSTTSISDSNSFCPVCGHKIEYLNQIAILSYFINKGKCKYCHSKIPKSHILFESGIFTYITAVLFSTCFSYLSFGIIIVSYELLKLLYILKFGKRENDFTKNLIASIFYNIIIFLMIFVLFFIKTNIYNIIYYFVK